MREIYLDFHGRQHSLYKNLIDYPPEGYKFLTDLTPISNITKIGSNSNTIHRFAMKSINRIIPASIIKPFFEKNYKLSLNSGFIYASGHIIFKDIPWVVDLEYVTQLSGYNLKLLNMYKKVILKYLASSNCRKIMPWTDAGKETIIRTFRSRLICDKVETIPLAVHPKFFIKKKFDDKIRLLFVSSQNFPRDFDNKGGKEVFAAFNILNKHYDNLELIVRSYVPNDLKIKYSKFKNITIIDNVIPWNILDQYFKKSDIFLFPSHNTPGLAILDAMSYELPVIATDVWANPELVIDGKTGFLIKKSRKINYYKENFIPNWDSIDSCRIIKNFIDPVVVNDIVKKASILIDSGDTRSSLGRAGRAEIETGKFSLKRRNYILKKIFDEIPIL